MLGNNKTIKQNIILLILLLTIFLYSFQKFTICSINISHKNSNLHKLDIKNQKNSFKIDLTAHPSKDSNSFLDLSANKELFFANISISHGIKQFLHFHSSVKIINL